MAGGSRGDASCALASDKGTAMTSGMERPSWMIPYALSESHKLGSMPKIGDGPSSMKPIAPTKLPAITVVSLPMAASSGLAHMAPMTKGKTAPE